MISTVKMGITMRTLLPTCALALLFPSVAVAQIAPINDEAASEEVAPEEAPAEEAPVEEAPAQDIAAKESTGSTSKDGGDGGRFRFGVAGGLGPMSGAGANLTYYGADLRFGWQINNAIGVYAVPQLGYYTLNGGGGTLGGGLIGASVVADYTLFDRLFLGAGLGYAVLNSPSGFEVHFRLGGYPLVSRSDEKVRRKGLMLGADLRLHMLQGATFVAPTFNIGYDAF